MIKRYYLYVIAVITCSIMQLYALPILEADIVTAAEVGDLEKVKMSLKSGAKINAQDSAGRTALLYASKNGHIGIVQFLLEKGANPDIPQVDGWTPLMWAAYNGQEASALALLNGGADYRILSYDAKTTRDYLVKLNIPEANIKQIVHERSGKDFAAIAKRVHPALLGDPLIRAAMNKQLYKKRLKK